MCMCVCVCVYMYVYIIYIYTCVCMCVYMYIYVYYICIHIYIYIICIYVYVCVCVYIYIFILTNFNCIYWLLILTFLIKNVFRQNFLRGRIQSPVGHLGWSFLHTGLSGWLFFRKGRCLGFSGDSEYDSGLTNDFLLSFFIPWNVPFKSACKYLW